MLSPVSWCPVALLRPMHSFQGEFLKLKTRFISFGSKLSNFVAASLHFLVAGDASLCFLFLALPDEFLVVVLAMLLATPAMLVIWNT